MARPPPRPPKGSNTTPTHQERSFWTGLGLLGFDPVFAHTKWRVISYSLPLHFPLMILPFVILTIDGSLRHLFGFSLSLSLLILSMPGGVKQFLLWSSNKTQHTCS